MNTTTLLNTISLLDQMSKHNINSFQQVLSLQNFRVSALVLLLPHVSLTRNIF